jgi:hypothetical protein
MDEDISIPTRQSRLPPELVDAIIKMLHDDRAALATCALVSRSWVPASRHNLFSELVLTPKNCSDVELPKFLTPRIASAVEHLVLESAQNLSNLPEIIGRLSNVTQLSLHRSIIFPGGGFPSPVILSMLAPLETLQLTHATVGPVPATILSLLHHCPRLRSLSFTAIISFHLGDVQQTLISQQDILMPELALLRVHGSPGLLAWLMPYWASVVHRLSTLEIDLSDSDVHVIFIRNLLEVAGSSLQVFRLISYSDAVLCE